MATLQIPITKAGNKKIAIETDDIPADMYQMALEEGLKVMLNKKMSKITVAKLEGEELAKAQAAAMEAAQKNLEDIMASKMKRGRSAASGENKVPGVVMTEARRLAKEVIKNEIRAAGMKISHVEASEITKAANALIASDPSYVEQAKANIESRTAKVATDQTEALARLQALGGIKESPKLVAKAEEEKAARKKDVSAAKAGKVAPRKAKAAAQPNA